MSRNLGGQFDAGATLAGVRLARVGRSGLAGLAGLRARDDVGVTIEGEAAWVSWEPAEVPARDEVLGALLPVPGVLLFREIEGRWYRAGRRLPEFDGGPPDSIGGEATVPLHRALLPGPVRAEPAGKSWGAVRLEVVRDERPRPASAAIVAARSLGDWAESAPTALLRGLRAARSGDRVLLIGRRLPPVVAIGRFWGDRVLLPLGFRADPELTEPRMAEVIGLGDDGEIGLIGSDGLVEVVPGGAFALLSRASARRMAGVVDRPSGKGPGGEGER